MYFDVKLYVIVCDIHSKWNEGPIRLIPRLSLMYIVSQLSYDQV